MCFLCPLHLPDYIVTTSTSLCCPLSVEIKPKARTSLASLTKPQNRSGCTVKVTAKIQKYPIWFLHVFAYLSSKCFLMFQVDLCFSAFKVSHEFGFPRAHLAASHEPTGNQLPQFSPCQLALTSRRRSPL